jgi:hypothetical protein
MTQMEQLMPTAAQQFVAQGSDIVVIPYSAYMEPDGSVRMGELTRIAAQAAVALYRQAATETTKVIAVGEHTYGLQAVSTTDLIYDYMAAEGVPADRFATERPVNANATPQQIHWLRQVFGDKWHRPPLLVGHEPHWPRIRDLCDLYGLPGTFADSTQVLAATGGLTPDVAQATALYAAYNARYEAMAARIQRSVTWLGPMATTLLFKALVRLRTPTVVDVLRRDGQARLYATNVRNHQHRITKEITL